MRYFGNSLLLCGIAFLWVPAANAQDVVIRRVTDHVITLSMTNLGMHTNVTVIETQKGLVVVETEMTPGIMKAIKEAAEKELGRNDWAYVINTHNHLHHAGGNGAFPDTPIIGTISTSYSSVTSRPSYWTANRTGPRTTNCPIPSVSWSEEASSRDPGWQELSSDRDISPH